MVGKERTLLINSHMQDVYMQEDRHFHTVFAMRLGRQRYHTLLRV